MKSDFRHHCQRCPQLTDSRTFTKGNFSFVVTAAASSPSKFHSKRCSLLLAMKSDFSHQISENMKSYFRNHFSEIRLQTSMLEMSLANRFKNLYRGQLFIFCLRRRRRFFYLKISLLEMLIAVGNEHLKKQIWDLVLSTMFLV